MYQITTDAPSPDVLVREFHTTFDAPIATGPATLDYPRVGMRMSLIEEEFCELLDAFYGPAAGSHVRAAIVAAQALDEQVRDVVEVADAAGDLVYVLYGLTLESAMPLDAVVHEIHRSNMSKVGADGTILRRADGKILKPKTYSPPDLVTVLKQHAAAPTRISA